MNKTYKKLIWLALAILGWSLTANAYGYSGGSGTINDPYLIYSKAQLKYLSENSSEWDYHFKQIADIEFETSDFTPGGDFYNDGKGFSPIGNNIGDRFYGSYDGDGHTITYLYIWRPEQNSVGMFGEVQSFDGLKNLTLENVVIKGNAFTGGLIGYLCRGSINSCNIHGEIFGSYEVGGLVGHCDATSAEINNCEVDAVVTATDFVGGILGSFIGYDEPNFKIANCKAGGTIQANSDAGGLVGKLESKCTIEKSQSSCIVMGGTNIGGFVGSLEDNITITDCYALGFVARNGGANVSLGGFVGKMNQSTITHCYSTGSVMSPGWNPTDKGFIGEYVSGTLTNNYWNTQSSGQSSSAGQGAGQLEGKTTAEMQQQATFVNWNFSNTWGIYPTCNNGYPYLQWQIKEPAHPLPADDATNIPLSGELTWLFPQEVDSYDLYLGPQGNMDLAVSGAAGALSGNYNYNNLAPNSNYEWQIRALTAKSTIWGPLWSFTTAPAPPAPAYPTPPDGAENIQVFGELAWSSSSGADTYDLLLGTPGNMDTLVSGEPADFSGSYNYTNLAFNALHQWQIIEHKSGNTFPGPVWSFTTTSAPGAPAFPNPPDGATDIPVSGNLTWVFSSDTENYMLLLGKTGNMDTLVSGDPATYTGSYSYTGLDYLTAYQWQIIEIKGSDTIPGPVWGFTSVQPNSLTYLSPENGATDIPLIGVSLNWHNSANALSYDLYFGEPGNTLKVASGPAGTFKSFDLDTLLYSTTYSWQVVEIFDFGAAMGLDLNFTTVTNCAENPVPEDGALEVPIMAVAMQWDDVYAAVYDLTVRTGGYGGDIVIHEYCFASEYTHNQAWDLGTTYYCTVVPLISDLLPNPEPCAPLQWQFTTITPLNEITCWDDLLRLSQNPIFWSLDIEQTADVDASGSRDLDDSDGFSPIGNFDTPFTGSYNGNGHSITGLHINRPGANMAGLLGYVQASGKEIRNLNLLDVDITGGSGSTGGLMAVISDGLVSDCKVTGVVNGIDNVGGLIGFAQKLSGNIQISDCRIEANVTGTGNSVGSIAGLNIGGGISDCSADGNVSGVNAVGGLVGFLGVSPVSGCEFSGAVNGQDAVGGLIGSADFDFSATIENCHVDAEVTGTGMAAGGIAGSVQNGAISNCSAAGTINGYQYVGGLAGNTLSVNIFTSFSYANLSGSTHVGGLVGLLFGKIANSYARGTITRPSGTEVTFGGLAGEFTFESINNCYSTGSVSGPDWFPTDKGFLGMKQAGTCASNYWDTQTSGQSSSAGQAPGEIEGKTTAEMQQQGTFANWDFTNTWAINPLYNGGYPYLQWQDCFNPANGGMITASQTIFSGDAPDSLTSTALPTGHLGVIDYKWQSSNESDTTGFSDIANSNAAGYQPGTLTQTTWFRRLARVDCMPGWSGAAESNTVKITVNQPPILAITAPLDGADIFDYPMLVSGTASDANNDLSEIFVRVNGGAWQLCTGTEIWSIDLLLTFGNHKIEAKAVDSQSLASNLEEVNIFVGVQNITLYQGWSIISSYLEPINADLETIMQYPVGQNLVGIMVNKSGGLFWPSQNINTIGNWNSHSAYKLYMNEESLITFKGDLLSETTLQFGTGPKYLPVLTNMDVAIDDALQNPMRDVLVIYNQHSNQIYWPEGGIFTLNTFKPGEGYLANFINPVTVTFPDYDMNPEVTKSGNPVNEETGPWNICKTGDVHLISLFQNALEGLENYSHIGAFNTEGNCIGFANITEKDQNKLLTVYGNDSYTGFKDGAESGELISFRAYDANTGLEAVLEALYNDSFPNHDGLFAPGGLSAISAFKKEAVGIGTSDLLTQISIYPNPAKEVLYIENQTSLGDLSGFIGTLTTTEGRLVKTFNITEKSTQVNISGLQPGVYLLHIQIGENILIERIIVAP
ncbi:MAG: T9SS type A sorting domain-containing protein [Bacteroidales bacterium]|nr:T9SS type A sorting domain-containing protein [Bacteroidales bacterium]